MGDLIPDLPLIEIDEQLESVPLSTFSEENELAVKSDILQQKNEQKEIDKMFEKKCRVNIKPLKIAQIGRKSQNESRKSDVQGDKSKVKTKEQLQEKNKEYIEEKKKEHLEEKKKEQLEEKEKGELEEKKKGELKEKKKG